MTALSNNPINLFGFRRRMLITAITTPNSTLAKIHQRKIIKYPENKVSLFKLLNKGSGGTTINMNDH